MTVIDWTVTPHRHVEPWRVRKGWGLIFCAATGLWLAIAFVIGGL